MKRSFHKYVTEAWNQGFSSFKERRMLTVSLKSACQHNSTGNHLNLSHVLGCNDCNIPFLSYFK